MRTLTTLAIALCPPFLLPLSSCSRTPPTPGAEPSASASATPTAAPSAEEQPKEQADEPKVVAPDPKKYHWLPDKGQPMPAAKNTLSAAIPTPPGYKRVAVAADSFGAWLRDLPIAAPNTPVVDFRGKEVHSGNDDYVEAVIAIDVGKKNLQQSTDVILRFQSEWLWSQGRRDITYKSATKDMLPFPSYCEGKRPLAQAGHLYWVKKKAPNDPGDRQSFREFLNVVFTWVNSSAIRMQSEAVDAKDIKPGDFFMQRYKGGYSVVVLDIAEKPSGQRVALLGQSLYPAMSIYVARLGQATPWFSLRPPDPILTAHTKELKWSDLRRLEVLSPE